MSATNYLDFIVEKYELVDALKEIVQIDEFKDSIVVRLMTEDWKIYCDVTGCKPKIGEWVAMWHRKYLERVELILPKPNEETSPSPSITMNFNLSLTSEQLHELKRAICHTLISHGELCGLKLLTEETIRMALKDEKFRTQLNLTKLEDVAKLFSSCMEQARKLCGMTGKLIKINVSRNYLKV